MDSTNIHRLNKPISTLDLSEELKEICEIFEFFTLHDLTIRHTRDVARLPSFNINLIHEYVRFLEEKGLGQVVYPV